MTKALGARTEQFLCVLALIALSYALFVCSFQCDDAYITFRTVKNVWNGHGLTWNPGDRVQAYTHPLWMMLCTLVYGVTREAYFSLSALSATVALASAFGLLALTRDRLLVACALLLALTASRAFVDFSVSGLENPLLAALLVATMTVARQDKTERRDLVLTLLFSLVFLTRSDAILLVLPLWVLLVLRQRPSMTILALGLAPALAWELFSLLYYGSFVPNTALAKLNLDVPKLDLVRQGAAYLADCAVHDPITMAAIASAVILPFVRPCALPSRAVSVGLGLYALYVLRIGGDFMGGRFFAAPFVLSLTSLSELGPFANQARTRLQMSAIGAIVIYSMLMPFAPLHSTLDYGDRARMKVFRGAGITDERAFYYPVTGLLPILVHYEQLQRTQTPLPPYFGAIDGALFARSPETVKAYTWVGFFGYFAGNKAVIDKLALADPLLARIPYRMNESFRIGHYPRPIPKGYLESYQTNENRIEDPELHRAFDAILLVIRGPIFSVERVRAIFDLMTGRYRAAFEAAAGDSRPQLF